MKIPSSSRIDRGSGITEEANMEPSDDGDVGPGGGAVADGDVDFAAMFSADNFDMIRQLIAADDDDCLQAGLDMLMPCFVYGNEESMPNFPAVEVARGLGQILTNSARPAGLRCAAARCLAAFLDSHAGATVSLMETGSFVIISQVLSDESPLGAIPDLIRAVEMGTNFRPADIAEAVGIKVLIQHFHRADAALRRVLSSACQRMTAAGCRDDYAEALDDLLSLVLLHGPVQLGAELALSIANVARRIKRELVPAAFSVRLAKEISRVTEGAVVKGLVQALSTLSVCTPHAQALIRQPIDWRQMFCTDFGGDAADIRSSAFNLMLNMLPDIDLPGEFWLLNNRTLEGADQFAGDLQPFALELVLRRVGRPSLGLASLAATMGVRQLPPTGEDADALHQVLVVMSQDQALLPFVLVIVQSFADPAAFVRAGLMSTLSSYKPAAKVKDWYEDRLAKLQARLGSAAGDEGSGRATGTLEEICAAIRSGEVAPLRFATSGMLSAVIRLLEGGAPLPAAAASSALVEALLAVLRVRVAQDLSDPFSGATLESLPSRLVTVDLRTPDGNHANTSVQIDLEFMSVENWWNQRTGLTPEILMAKLSESAYRDIVVCYDRDHVAGAFWGMVARAVGVEESRRFHFRVGGRDFSVYDGVFHSLGRAVADPQRFADTVTVEVLEGDVPRAQLNIRELPPGLSEPLRALQALHERGIDVVRDLFAGEVRAQLSSPLLTIGFHNTASKLVYHAPWMFDRELRHAFLRMVAYDLDYSAAFMNHYFNDAPWPQRSWQLRAQLSINRSRVFEDGLLALEAFGRGALRFDVRFVGEEGIGSGPTQEFFHEFSRLLGSRPGLWRPSMSTGGLFPSPAGDPQMFRVFGMLCGKVMLMDMLIDLPISPAFFRRVKGETIALSDVDEALARALRSSDGLIGMPFTYPGLPELELMEGGKNVEVSEENFGRFVELVEKVTTDVSKQVEAFREGFSYNMPIDALRLLSGAEVVSVICGEGVKIAREDLHRYVEISHGYTPSSPQVQMLFDTIVEMDESERSLLVKFITGCDKLPVTGLRGLNPRLTIAQRTPSRGQAADDCLPSVMTCANYLKIPAYSSRGKLQEKLSVAIHEGQSCFLLS